MPLPRGGPGPAELLERLGDEAALLRAELAAHSDALRLREELHGEEVRPRRVPIGRGRVRGGIVGNMASG